VETEEKVNSDFTQKTVLNESSISIPNVWAAAEGEEPYRTDVDVDRLESAWSGPQWDLRLIESSPTKSYEIGRIVIDK
jgi:hypothetical protein